MGSRSGKVDRLSLLPDEILAQILSLVPTDSTVRTSILSKRWRYCWTLVHSFDFCFINGESFNSFKSYVDGVLKLCKTSQVKLFRLHMRSLTYKNSIVSRWINEAVRLNVSELDIQALSCELPRSLFTCKTLTKLKLAVGGGYDTCDLHVPSGVILPCLKTIDISVHNEPFVHVCKLTRGCPVLESLTLSLEFRSLWGYDNNDYNFNIPTLKRFELRKSRRTSGISKVVLNVPNLEYLFLGGFLSSSFVMEDLPSFVEASVLLIKMEYLELRIELLKGLSGAKSLSWSTSTNLVSFSLPLPKFPNLKHFEFSCFSYRIMFQVLQCSCVLEHLCIEEPERFYWEEPRSVPNCMLSHLETVKLIGFTRRESDINFVRYLLANAMVLRTLTLMSKKWSPADEAWLYDRLLKFPRASGRCKIHFDSECYNEDKV